jgi:hypothetical protein
MILAPGCGIGPTPSIESGTAASHSSSCFERVGPLLEYHEPAWEASRVPIVVIRGEREVRGVRWGRPP